MNFDFGKYLLRAIEPSDLEQLYHLKNDPDMQAQLDGFTLGYSMQDLQDWLENGRKRTDQVLWAMYDREEKKCFGHIGLYKIDLRVGSAELGTFVGDKTYWKTGIGIQFINAIMDFGFRGLNLHRIYMTQLATNHTSAALERAFGFKEEGRLRDAQYKNGQYVDVMVLGVLRHEFENLKASRLLRLEKAEKESAKAI